jgi:5-hydroxyisourate hydrolase-like protein (transthyretin family)
MEDLEIEVEYQAETIGKYDLGFNGTDFVLKNKQTACLAQDSCGIPADKLKVNISQVAASTNACCTPGGGCC